MRQHVFSGTAVAAMGGLDEDGIPYVAYANTKGDHPISAEPFRVSVFAYLVTYEPDSIRQE